MANQEPTRRYTIPRALDTDDQLFPGFTMAQAACTLAACAVAYWVWTHSGLPFSLRFALVVYLPILGALAKRKVFGWDTVQWAQAAVHRLTRPGRTVYRTEGDE